MQQLSNLVQPRSNQSAGGDQDQSLSLQSSQSQLAEMSCPVCHGPVTWECLDVVDDICGTSEAVAILSLVCCDGETRPVRGGRGRDGRGRPVTGWSSQWPTLTPTTVWWSQWHSETTQLQVLVELSLQSRWSQPCQSSWFSYSIWVQHTVRRKLIIRFLYIPFSQQTVAILTSVQLTEWLETINYIWKY